MDFKQLLKLEKEGEFAQLRQIAYQWKRNKISIEASSFNLEMLFKRVLLHDRVSSDGLISRDRSTSLSRQQFNPSTNQASWTAVITLWKRSDYLHEQLAAIQSQTIPVSDIIIIINDKHLSLDSIQKECPGAHIIKSSINSLYTRWFAGYLGSSDYICVFDDDVIPARRWIENCLRCSAAYNAVVGSAGRMYSASGIHGFFRLVTSEINSEIKNHISCSDKDIFVDWICNSYFFKRDWIGTIIKNKRYDNSHKTFDDIQLSTTLQIAGIRCVVPCQPSTLDESSGSTKPSYGDDQYAIWKTNSNQHFKSRKEYVEKLISNGYIPVASRVGLHRIVVIIPFSDPELLDDSIRSLGAQTYRNFVAVLIDDSQQVRHSVSEVCERYGVTNFLIIRTRIKAFPLLSRILAKVKLHIQLNDIILHLDGDDYLSSPDALELIAKSYLDGTVQATYGGSLSFYPKNPRSFWEYYPFSISKSWNFSTTERTEEHTERFLNRYSEHDLRNGWRNAEWGALHARSYLFSAWLFSSKEHYVAEGKFLRVATDAAIMLPILDGLEYQEVAFVPELIYTYRNGANTIHNRNEVGLDHERDRSRQAISKANFDRTVNLADSISQGSLGLGNFPSLILTKALEHPSDISAASVEALQPLPAYQESVSIAICTVVTPNYLADGFTAVQSTVSNIKSENVFGFVYVSTPIGHAIDYPFQLISGNVSLITPHQLLQKNAQASLASKYGHESDEFRWAMKSVLLMELIDRGFSSALFVDPDIFTVSDITDIASRISDAKASVFPHFRDPDDAYLRGVLYRDGFYNGGMIGISKLGYEVAEKLYLRCLKDMTKNPQSNRWDDQKYFDLIPLENDNVYINQDRGIDYNPWNYEPVMGLLSPSIKSFMLASGSFVRCWHVSTNMIKQSTEGHDRHIAHRPVTMYYLYGLSWSIVLLICKLKRTNTCYIYGLEERFVAVNRNLRQLAPECKFLEILGKAFKLCLTDLPDIDDKICEYIGEVYELLMVMGFHSVLSILVPESLSKKEFPTGDHLEMCLNYLKETQITF